MKGKPTIVQEVYKDIMSDIENDDEAALRAARYFQIAIDAKIAEAAATLRVERADLLTSLNEYNPQKSDVPYLKTLVESSEHTPETFEQYFTGQKFRRRTVVFEEYWKQMINEKLVPLKIEMATHEGRN